MTRQYKRITKNQFEEFLDSLEYGWQLTGHKGRDNFTRELVYEIDIQHKDLTIRVYSSIDGQTLKSRDKGKDAIRTVVYSDEYSRPVAGKRYTQRIETWPKNLRKKIKDLHNNLNNITEICSKCGSYMVIREGKYGEFHGCLEYPDCENTEPL